MSIRVVLVDDHQIVREGLRTLLGQQTDICVIAEAENGRAAVDLAREVQPDIVIMDVAMPDLNGIDATRQIKANCPTVKVIALSMHADRRFIVQMLKAGAEGYLLKDCAFEELSHAIRTLMASQPYLSPRIANIVLTDYLDHVSTADSSVFSILTPREREVLQLVAEGHSTRETATLLCIGVKTVETHRQAIMDKLKTNSVAELTRYAIREGLVPLE